MNTACTIEKLLEFERLGVLVNISLNEVVTQKVRAILFDWLLEVSAMFKLKYETILLTFEIFDKFISIYQISDKDKIQLYGIASLSLAAKKEEIYCPELSDYVYICDGTYRGNDIVDAESRVFYTLGCNLEFPIVLNYIRKSNTMADVPYDIHNLCKIFSLLHICCCKEKVLPSVLATSCLYLFSSFDKSFKFHNFFEIPESVYLNVAYDLRKIIRKINNSSIFKKYIEKQLTKNKLSNYESILDKLNNFSDVFAEKTTCPLKYQISEYANQKFVRDESSKEDLKYANQRFVRDESSKEGSEYAKSSVNTIIVNRKLDKMEKLGEGSFGQVYKCDLDGIIVALKKFNNSCSYSVDEGIEPCTLREISILLFIAENCGYHKNIISLLHVNQYTGKSYVYPSAILEFMDSDAKKYSQNNPLIICDPEFQLFVTKELIEGLTFLHSYGFIHRDIKPQNILVKGVWGVDFEIKYADLGASRGGVTLTNGLFTQGMCTLWYRAPEILLGKNGYGASLDIWSLACSLYEICSGKPLFVGDCDTGQLLKIFRLLGTPQHIQSEDFPYWENINTLPYYKDSFPQWKKSAQLNDLLSKHIFVEEVRSIIIKGLIYDPELRPNITQLTENIALVKSEMKMCTTPEEEWKKIYRASKLTSKEDKDKIKENILLRLDEIAVTNDVKDVAKLFDYLAEEGYIMMVDSQKFFETVKMKIIDFHKGKEKEIFKYVQENTKQFIYACTGIRISEELELTQNPDLYI